jgi:hypothetical protein
MNIAVLTVAFLAPLKRLYLWAMEPPAQTFRLAKTEGPPGSRTTSARRSRSEGLLFPIPHRLWLGIPHRNGSDRTVCNA